jgi:hypothetical protein
MGVDPDTPLLIGDKTVTYEEWRRRRIAKAQGVLKAKT